MHYKKPSNMRYKHPVICITKCPVTCVTKAQGLFEEQPSYLQSVVDPVLNSHEIFYSILWFVHVITIYYNTVPYIVLHHLMHRDTALAILAEKDGLTSLEADHKPPPLQLLIKEMPGETWFIWGLMIPCNYGKWLGNFPSID